MSKDAAMDNILVLLGVTTPEDAVSAVQKLLEIAKRTPALSINSDGGLSVTTGITVGQVLRLLALAQRQVEGVVIGG